MGSVALAPKPAGQPCIRLRFLGLILAATLSLLGDTHAQSNEKHDESLKTLTARMESLATKLETVAGIAERVGQVVDRVDHGAREAVNPRDGGSASVAHDPRLDVLALQQVMAERGRIIERARLISERLGTEPKNLISNIAGDSRHRKPAKSGADYELLLKAAADLQKINLKAELEQSASALEAAKSASLVATSIEQLIQLVLPWQSREMPDDLRNTMELVRDANERVHRAAMRAEFAVDSAMMDLSIGYAVKRLGSAGSAAIPGNLIEFIVGYAGVITAKSVAEQHKEQVQRLEKLKQQKKKILKESKELEAQIQAAEQNCGDATKAALDKLAAAGRAAAQAAATAAAAGALFGSFFIGPVGAAIGAFIGSAGSTMSPADIANLVANIEECKNLIALMKQLEELRARLAEIELAMKRILQEIEQARKDEQERRERQIVNPSTKALARKPGAISRTTGGTDGVIQQSAPAKSKLKKDGAKGSTVAEHPCGTPDNPCRRRSTGPMAPGLLEGDRGFAVQGPSAVGSPTPVPSISKSSGGDGLRLR